MRSLLSILLLSLSVACDSAPDFVLPERVSCRDCTISIDPLLTIGDSIGENILNGRPFHVWQSGPGRYWISVLDAFPMVYDSSTRELRAFARRGEGPGEFRFAALHSELPGDSMLVSEVQEFRVMSPELTIARVIQMRDRIEAVAVMDWPDNMLGRTSTFGRNAHSTLTFARFDFSSDTVAVIDTVLVTSGDGGDGVQYANMFRLLGRPGRGGDIWITRLNAYRLTHYSPTGEALDSVARQLSWFPGGGSMRMGGPVRPSAPQMLTAWSDDAGRLWALAAEPRLNTRDAWSGVAAIGGEVREVRVASLPPEYKLYRTLIEVIDPAARRVVARRTFDGYIFGALSENRVAAYVETEAGVPVLTIYRLALQQAR